MARPQKAAKTAPRLDEHWHKRLREAGFLLLLPLAIYLFACLFSYDATDPGWSHAGDPARGIHNFGGAFGAWIADLAFYLVGIVAYALPILLLVVGTVVLRGTMIEERSPLEPTLRLVGFVAFFFAAPGLAVSARQWSDRCFLRARVACSAISVGDALMHSFGPLGAGLFLLALFWLRSPWLPDFPGSD